MHIKSENGQRFKSNSSFLIFLVSFLFLASIAVSIAGALYVKKDEKDNNLIEDEVVEEERREENISELFDESFEEKNSNGNPYSINDPFRKDCGGSSGLSFQSFTVCNP